MSFVTRQVQELKAQGMFIATRVEPDAISKVINMDELDYYGLDISTLESYLGLLAQQVYYIQQECNIAVAREIELANDFKMEALPSVIGAKIRSVEERWLFASSLSPELKMKFDSWQRAVIDATLKKDLSEPVVEKLNVLKKIYDDRRMEGRNRNIHKYTDGGS
ncbi:hypothetical protein [Paenibacillus illinoisensis]|uniref:hypothetical protein n=1 Tax=Paenibacillus illinoisensis TaxID=59845 RepID=UPI0030187D7F